MSTNPALVDYQAVRVAEPPKASPVLMFKLSAMMFLEFGIQGAWLPLLFTFFTRHRGISDDYVGYLAALGAIGAILSPFAAGQIADRRMNAERVLGISHMLGALLVLRMAFATSLAELFIESFLYGLLYTPTLALVNAISFRHLPDRDRDFGKVRVWGTVGWIVVGIGVGQWLVYMAGKDRSAQIPYMGHAFILSAIMGLVFGVYSFFLPKTPPAVVKSDGRAPRDPRQSGDVLEYAPVAKSQFAPGEALKHIRRQPLITAFLISFPIAAVHQFFFVRTVDFLSSPAVKLPEDWWLIKFFGGGAGLMTIGQISELLVLALMPLLATRFTKKVLLTVGLTAYALRFLAFAYFPTASALIPALALHGLCFGCFFFLIFMIIDEHTPKDVRSSAQNLFNLIIFGIGVIAGNLAAGWIGQWLVSDGVMDPSDWRTFFAIPLWVTVACLVAFLIFYPNRSRIPNKEGLAAA
jgi:MFS family permease